MTAEFIDDPKQIEPLLNPEYWGQEFTNTSERWPTREPSQDDRQFAARCLVAYIKQGMNMDPLNTIYPGEVFTPGAYPPGTILLSVSERLSAPSNRLVKRPMHDFTDRELPAWHTAEDDKITREGYGYNYVSHPLLNIVVHPPASAPNVLILSKENLEAGLDTRTPDYYAAKLRAGVPVFTVGKTYNFVGRTGESLTRVNELHACGFGVKAKRTKA